MPLKEEKLEDGSIPVSKLPTGRIARITSWDQPDYVGKCVQHIKCSQGSLLYEIGGDLLWYNFDSLPATCCVRILPNGTTLIVFDNELELHWCIKCNDN